MLRVLGFSFLIAVSVLAAPSRLDRLKVGSQIYTNITVVGVNATDLYFTYDKGIKNVKLRLLDPETQKLFNYDPKAATEIERQQTQDDARFQTSVVARGVIPGTSAGPGAPTANEKRHASSDENIIDAISDQSPVGKPGPTIGIEKWSGSTPPPTLKGKFVLVTFWTPWSIPCQKWIPPVNVLQKKFSDKLDVIGFIPEADAEDRSMDSRLEFPYAVDEKGRYQAALGVKAVPFAVLMDPSGIILYEGHPAALGEKELKTLLAK
jgi:hypothetical protein